MKLLFDENLSFKLCAQLSDIFPDSSQVRLEGLEHFSDAQVWAHAKDHGFVLVTQDADFLNLSMFRGHPPKIIWLRCGNQTTTYIAALLRRHHHNIVRFLADPQVACLEIA